MSNPSKITVAGHDYILFSAPTSAYDPAIYRWEDTSVYPMYRPTIKLSGRPNKNGTNVNMKLRIDVPIVQVNTTLNTQTSTNKAVATLDFTSLQNSDVKGVQEAVDALIAAAAAFKANLVNGITA